MRNTKSLPFMSANKAAGWVVLRNVIHVMLANFDQKVHHHLTQGLRYNWMNVGSCRQTKGVRRASKIINGADKMQRCLQTPRELTILGHSRGKNLDRSQMKVDSCWFKGITFKQLQHSENGIHRQWSNESVAILLKLYFQRDYKEYSAFSRRLDQTTTKILSKLRFYG